MPKTLKMAEPPNFAQDFSASLLGQAVKAKRTELGLRIEDTAALCGVAKQTYMNIEHGHSSVKLESVLRVCHGLGVKLFIQPWKQGARLDEWQ